MSHLTLLRNVTGGLWLINKEAGEAYMPAIIQLITGEKVTSFKDEGEPEKSPFCVSAENPESKIDSEFRNHKVPEGSVAVIPVQGALMKEDYCGEPGTATMARWIKNAESNPNIIGIVLSIDSPGGHVDGTAELARVISESAKPIVSFADGMMASAAYWIGSSADYVMTGSPTTLVGSIGTKITLQDYSGYYEKFGLKVHDITADKSKDKNRFAKEAFKGNYTPIKKELLNPMNEIFLTKVKENREGKLPSESEEPLTGKVYISEKAKEMGLIDGNGTFREAIEKVQELSTQSNSNSNMLNKFKALSALAAKQKKGEAIAAEEIEAVNAELVSNGITGFVLAESETVEANETQLAAAAEERSAIVAILEPEATEEEAAEYNLEEGVQALADALEASETEVERLGAIVPKPAKPKSTSKKPEITSEEETEAEFYSKSDQEIDGMLDQLNGK